MTLKQATQKQEEFMKTYFFIQTRPELSMAEKLVLHTIMHHARNKKTAWPSERRIARLSGLSERHVKRIVKRLSDLGLIHVCRENRNNTYTLIQGPGTLFYKWRKEYSDIILNVVSAA